MAKQMHGNKPIIQKRIAVAKITNSILSSRKKSRLEAVLCSKMAIQPSSNNMIAKELQLIGEVATAKKNHLLDGVTQEDLNQFIEARKHNLENPSAVHGPTLSVTQEQLEHLRDIRHRLKHDNTPIPLEQRNRIKVKELIVKTDLSSAQASTPSNFSDPIIDGIRAREDLGDLDTWVKSMYCALIIASLLRFPEMTDVHQAILQFAMPVNLHAVMKSPISRTKDLLEEIKPIQFVGPVADMLKRLCSPKILFGRKEVVTEIMKASASGFIGPVSDKRAEEVSDIIQEILNRANSIRGNYGTFQKKLRIMRTIFRKCQHFLYQTTDSNERTKHNVWKMVNSYFVPLGIRSALDEQTKLLYVAWIRTGKVPYNKLRESVEKETNQKKKRRNGGKDKKEGGSQKKKARSNNETTTAHSFAATSPIAAITTTAKVSPAAATQAATSTGDTPPTTNGMFPTIPERATATPSPDTVPGGSQKMKARSNNETTTAHSFAAPTPGTALIVRNSPIAAITSTAKVSPAAATLAATSTGDTPPTTNGMFPTIPERATATPSPGTVPEPPVMHHPAPIDNDDFVFPCFDVSTETFQMPNEMFQESAKYLYFTLKGLMAKLAMQPECAGVLTLCKQYDALFFEQTRRERPLLPVMNVLACELWWSLGLFAPHTSEGGDEVRGQAYLKHTAKSLATWLPEGEYMEIGKVGYVMNYVLKTEMPKYRMNVIKTVGFYYPKACRKMMDDIMETLFGSTALPPPPSPIVLPNAPSQHNDWEEQQRIQAQNVSRMMQKPVMHHPAPIDNNDFVFPCYDVSTETFQMPNEMFQESAKYLYFTIKGLMAKLAMQPECAGVLTLCKQYDTLFFEQTRREQPPLPVMNVLACELWWSLGLFAPHTSEGGHEVRGQACLKHAAQSLATWLPEGEYMEIGKVGYVMNHVLKTEMPKYRMNVIKTVGFYYPKACRKMMDDIMETLLGSTALYDWEEQQRIQAQNVSRMMQKRA